jgi:hypothetical protein
MDRDEGACPGLSAYDFCFDHGQATVRWFDWPITSTNITKSWLQCAACNKKIFRSTRFVIVTDYGWEFFLTR